MALLHAVGLPFHFLPAKDDRLWMRSSSPSFNLPIRFPLPPARFRICRLGASKSTYNLSSGSGMNGLGQTNSDSDEEDESPSARQMNDPYLMDAQERKEWRQRIRQVIEMNPDVEEELDPVERRKKMEKLLSEYPLVVDEEDPDWPENDDGWGFKLGSFFDKITIKNVQKDDVDDEKYDSDNELVWRDDNYIRPIKDITTAEWEETVFKDISPLVVLVHNRYKRPKENERVRDELEKAVHIIWNCGLPSPRCIAIDAVVELDLISALKVTSFPQLVFTKSGKILYREEGVRNADDLSKIMAFFYYGAAKPPCLASIHNCDEPIPSLSINSELC